MLGREPGRRSLRQLRPGPGRRAALTALALVALAAVPVAWACGGDAGASAAGARAAASTGAPIEYTVSFDNAAHREARIEMILREVPPGTLELRMSRTSPGRYALHEFAKNVYQVEVDDGGGGELTVHRPDPHQWDVSGHSGTVRVAYTLFADRADGTYAAVGPTGALLNAPASFMFARGLRDRPVRIRFDMPVGWSAASQLFDTEDPAAFTAPDGEYFLDSPVLLGDLDVRSFDLAGQEIRLALLHEGSDEAAADYLDMVRAAVLELTAVFGELPDFEGGRYTFLAAYLPWVSGDGMEHRNSTVLTRVARLPEDAVAALGTVAHEFFHAWNIERIRPASLEPFDFEAANMSRELWFGEGFTSYYDDLALVRAGLIDLDRFAARMGGLVHAVTVSPGRRYFSPVEMSMQAPFVDAAVSIDPQNRRNTFVSYYTWGAAIGLGLDLTLRSRFGRTLDDLMRVMWTEHGRTFRTYEVSDVEQALATVTGDTDFARDFFDRHVRGSELVDYPALFAEFGLEVGLRNPGAAWVEPFQAQSVDGGLLVAGRTMVGGPAYRVGLDAGDVITALDGIPIGSLDDLQRVVGGHVPGDVVRVAWIGRAGAASGDLALVEDPSLVGRTAEAAGRTITPEVEARRRAWLASRAREVAGA